jgi:hypothetical protein
MSPLNSIAVVAIAVALAAVVPRTGLAWPARSVAALAPNATPEEKVQALLSAAARFPSAGDDFTMYITAHFDVPEVGP